MSSHGSWHSQSAFWEFFEPILFDQRRLSATKQEVDELIQLLRMESPRRILDLGCGIGRHSLALAARGHEVVGVDLMDAYIGRARQAAVERVLAVDFVVGDMRTYRGDGEFDVVVNLFGTFGYFDDEDNRRVIENALACLRPGGQFLIETAGKEIQARNFQARDWSEDGDLLLLSERRVSERWERIDTRWIVLRGAERTEFNVSVRSYSAMELASLFQACGFGDVRVFGSLAGAAYDQHAQRLVVLGRK
jgi:SAM-dependent methyltransferase